MQGKDPSSRARRRKWGSSGCGRDSRASSRVETAMSGNFLSCSKGVNDPFEVPEVRCDYARDTSAEIELSSPGGENLLDFLEMQQELSTYDLDLRDPLCWPHERPVPMQVARGTLHRKRERNSSVVPPFPEFHRCLSPFQGNLFSLHCLDFQA